MQQTLALLKRTLAYSTFFGFYFLAGILTGAGLTVFSTMDLIAATALFLEMAVIKHTPS